jgi:hypothetical protein
VVMFQACQDYTSPMYETLRNDYLYSSSTVMTIDCMVYWYLISCRQ